MPQNTSTELLEVVAIAANQSASIEDAAQTCLERICAFTGWTAGHLYLVADLAPQPGIAQRASRLVPTNIWHLGDPERLEQFRRQTEQSYFDPGSGLPGLVMQSGRAVWISDISKEGNFLRRKPAEDAGIMSAFAFPILTGTQIIGVLEFFALAVTEPDISLLETMSNIGIQLGRVVERERAERALRESEEKFRSVAESANDAIISCDSGGYITFWNKGAQAIFGYSEDEVCGRSLDMLMPERYIHQHQAGMARVNMTGETHVIGKTVELHGLRKDGSEFPLELSLATWSTSAGTFYTGIIRDITERAQVTQQLKLLNQELEERVAERTADLDYQRSILATILEATPIAIVFGDTQLRIINSNREWARLMGVDLEQARGRPIFEVIPTARQRASLYEQVLAGKPVDLLSAPLTPAYDTAVHYYDVFMRPVYNSRGKITGLLSAIVDVTERATLDRQKDEFMALASHELKTPLAAIKGYAQMSLRIADRIQDDALLKYLGIVDEQTRRMTALVAELLDVTHIQRGTLTLNKQQVDLRQLTEQTVEEFQVTSPGFTFSVDVPESVVMVEADVLRIQQVLINLLENAVKYSGESRTVEISLTPADEYATVEVRDYGIGVPLDAREHLFEQFFRSSNIVQHHSGLGLGLFVSKAIVAQHGGRIWFEARGEEGTTGSGSVFCFSVPLVFNC